MTVAHASVCRRAATPLLWAGALFIAACGTTAPARRPSATDPLAVLDAVRAREARVHTLRVRFASELQQGDEKRSADGVLVVKKPDRFRMRLLAPFGFTVLDYAYVGGEVHLELPLQGQRLTNADLRDDALLAPAELRQAFLRAEAAFPGTCEPSAAHQEVVVGCRDDAGTLLRTIRIDAAGGTITEEVDVRDEKPWVVTRFQDYREAGSYLLPFVIEIAYPHRDVFMRITVRDYEVNPVLANDLFEVSS